jgi:hypothetical protein
MDALRAAAPWQTMRRDGKMQLHPEDFRLKPRTESTTCRKLFSREALVGAAVAREAATAFADFRIRDSGFGRIQVSDARITPAQAGRIVQRLLEIDTYCTMALLALPVGAGSRASACPGSTSWPGSPPQWLPRRISTNRSCSPR